MALTTAQQVRLRIQDPWRYGSEEALANGTASAFKLAQGAPYSTVISGSALAATQAGWSATGCAFNTALGLATFSSLPAGQTPFMFTYQWAVFSDDEVGQFTADGGTVRGAALMAVRTLRFNAPRRARWAAPDGTQVDDTQVMRALKELEDDLQAEIIRYEEGPAGDYTSWAEGQAEY